MPELPDVEGFRRVLAGHAAGRRIERVDVHDAGVLHGMTAGQLDLSLRAGQAILADRRQGPGDAALPAVRNSIGPHADQRPHYDLVPAVPACLAPERNAARIATVTPPGWPDAYAGG